MESPDRDVDMSISEKYYKCTRALDITECSIDTVITVHVHVAVTTT